MAHQAQHPPVPNEPVVSLESSPPSDRRTEQRVIHKAVVVMPFGPDAHGGFEHAMLTDCSAKGIGMVLNQPLQPGTRFFLKLKLTTVALVIYTVKHCQPVKEGYRIGADFYGISGTDADRDTAAESVLTALLAS